MGFIDWIRSCCGRRATPCCSAESLAPEIADIKQSEPFNRTSEQNTALMLLLSVPPIFQDHTNHETCGKKHLHNRRNIPGINRPTSGQDLFALVKTNPNKLISQLLSLRNLSQYPEHASALRKTLHVIFFAAPVAARNFINACLRVALYGEETAALKSKVASYEAAPNYMRVKLWGALNYFLKRAGNLYDRATKPRTMLVADKEKYENEQKQFPSCENSMWRIAKGSGTVLAAGGLTAAMYYGGYQLWLLENIFAQITGVLIGYGETAIIGHDTALLYEGRTIRNSSEVQRLIAEEKRQEQKAAERKAADEKARLTPIESPKTAAFNNIPREQTDLKLSTTGVVHSPHQLGTGALYQASVMGQLATNTPTTNPAGTAPKGSANLSPGGSPDKEARPEPGKAFTFDQPSGPPIAANRRNAVLINRESQSKLPTLSQLQRQTAAAESKMANDIEALPGMVGVISISNPTTSAPVASHPHPAPSATAALQAITAATSSHSSSDVSSVPVTFAVTINRDANDDKGDIWKQIEDAEIAARKGQKAAPNP